MTEPVNAVAIFLMVVLLAVLLVLAGQALAESSAILQAHHEIETARNQPVSAIPVWIVVWLPAVDGGFVRLNEHLVVLEVMPAGIYGGAQ